MSRAVTGSGSAAARSSVAVTGPSAEATEVHDSPLELGSGLSWPAHAVIPDSPAELPEDDAPLVAPARDRPVAGIRLSDGRALCWAEYGNPRGVPCVVVPDSLASRVSPGWMLHDTTLPKSVRLLAVDRPGTGQSDPLGPGATDDLAADLLLMIHTLAVGRVVMVGVGSGATVALDVAERSSRAVAQVVVIGPRGDAETPEVHRRRSVLRRAAGFRRSASAPWRGPLHAWAAAAGGEDLLHEHVWARSRSRMSDRARDVLGDRWRDFDFRRAVAEDLAQPRRTDRGAPAPGWLRSWSGSCPVLVAHPADEESLPLSSLRTLVADRAGWTLLETDRDAVFSVWAQVLEHAARRYLDAGR